MTILSETSKDPTALVPAIRRELLEIDPEAAEWLRSLP